MAVKYDIIQTETLLNTEKSYYLRTAVRQTVGSRQMARDISAANSLTEADVHGALSALSTYIVERLKAGDAVHLDGLGYFSVALAGDIRPDRHGTPRVRHPRVRTIRFQPEAGLRHRFFDTRFAAGETKSTIGATIEDDLLTQALDTLTAANNCFTASLFIRLLALRHTTGYRLLKKLLEKGLIRNIGTPRRRIFVR